MKYYIIAGETSGDIHGANLVKELKKLDQHAAFRCWGGDRMRKEGVTLVKHIRDLAFMGFYEVIANLKTIFGNLRYCKQDILNYKPDVLILIDYPGFNLRIAEFAKSKNILVHYYISPQVWAWKQSRVHKIKKVVDRMFVILPFEKEFYKKFHFDVDFVGHPLLDELRNKMPALNSTEGKEKVDKTIALLPGSRKQEVSQILPLMLSVIPFFPGYHFIIAAADSITDDYLKQFDIDHSVKIERGNTHEVIASSSAALVTSGTATLETALIGTPLVVCYKGGAISYAIARQLVKIKYISLVNLILDRPVVSELIQDELNTENLHSELSDILTNQQRIGEMKESFIELREKLGGEGASGRTANLIYGHLLAKK